MKKPKTSNVNNVSNHFLQAVLCGITRKHTEDQDLEFRCEECSKSYNRKEHLEKHISSVHKEVSNISPERSHQKSSRRHI